MYSKSPVITTKEKEAPAYRKKLEEENQQLKESVETIQNQASALQQKNVDLEKENVSLKERLSGSGIKEIAKDITILLAAGGISYFIERQYITASILLLLSFCTTMLYWLISNLKKK